MLNILTLKSYNKFTIKKIYNIFIQLYDQSTEHPYTIVNNRKRSLVSSSCEDSVLRYLCDLNDFNYGITTLQGIKIEIHDFHLKVDIPINR